MTAGWLGLWSGLFLVLATVRAPTPGPAAPPTLARSAILEAESGPEAAKSAIVMLVIDGGINPAIAEYIQDGIALAQEQGAAALLIKLDTPGGLLESTKIIVKDILAAPVPVIVYVAPSGGGAASAGVFITLSAHVAAMAPGTNIGAAHPVGGQGETIDGDMGEKVENFTASLSRTIAQQRGRNVEWAEKVVRESVAITETEAVDQHVVDLVADDVDDLLRQVDGRTVDIAGNKMTLRTAGATVQPHEMLLRQKIINLLANPNVAYLLMMIGILGLYVELTHPGVVFPGVAGAICLLLGMAALQVLPINYSGLALIMLGLALLVAELFLPSFGILGVGGIVAFVLGSLLLFNTPDSTLPVDRGIIFAAAGTLGTFMLVIGLLVVRSQRRRPSLGSEGLVGEVGEVRRTMGPKKVKVFVHGEYWDAETDDGSLELGSQVEVTAVDGMRMRVRRRPAG